MEDVVVRGRRAFLKGGSLVIGALAGRARTAAGAEPDAIASLAASVQTAGFGWEVCNLENNGANTYVEIQNNMYLENVEVDVSASIMNARATGFAEVLCDGGLIRQAAPSFARAAAAYIDFAQSGNFGPVKSNNPNRLDLVLDGALLQDRFLGLILKTWVPANGAAAATSRHVSVSPGLLARAGDYLVFHMDHAGVPVDAEMQIAITYQLV